MPQFDAQQRRIFETKNGLFIIVVEGRPGASGLAAGTSLIPGGPDNRPDIQIQSTHIQGNGDPQIPGVCPPGPSSTDLGVPAINPPNFGPDQAITAAINDFACRFDPFVGLSAPCTILDATRDPALIDPTATVQFCDVVAGNAPFVSGEAVLSVKLRDSQGNTGPTAQIVVRVATPTPGPP